MGVYSFENCEIAIKGPNGAFSMGNGEGIAEEGITISMEGAKVSTTWGADGIPMHSLHASRGAKVSLKVQKTSPLNAKLNTMYRRDSSSSAFCGQNTITTRNPVSGDNAVCTSCAFEKHPDLVYAKEAGLMDWTFIAGYADEILGDGGPVSAFILAGNG